MTQPCPDCYSHPACAVAISGMKGTGKTTEFLKRIKAHKAKWKFVFDPEREVSTRLRIPICTTIEQMSERLSKAQIICFDPSDLFDVDTKDGMKEAVEFFCRWIWNWSPYLDGIKLLAIDEIQDCTELLGNGVPLHLNKISQKGRRKRIDFICIVNLGINQLPEKLRGQCTELVVFQTTSHNAIAILQDRFSKDDLEKIRNLKRGQFLTA
jgi:hypothetical protein